MALAYMHAHGLGVPQNASHAQQLYHEAAELSPGELWLIPRLALLWLSVRHSLLGPLLGLMGAQFEGKMSLLAIVAGGLQICLHHRTLRWCGEGCF